MPASVEQILVEYTYRPELIEKVSERKAPTVIKISDPDPTWPEKYQRFEQAIQSNLGALCLRIDHVGSTSVPGLPAKAVIDIDIAVADPADEAAYIPQLEAAGFQLLTREPHYYEHRYLGHDDPPCNLHVYTLDSAEMVRHRVFRDRLRRSAEDRELYGNTKKKSAEETAREGGKMSEYTKRKEGVVRQILHRAFQDEGYLP